MYVYMYMYMYTLGKKRMTLNSKDQIRNRDQQLTKQSYSLYWTNDKKLENVYVCVYICDLIITISNDV